MSANTSQQGQGIPRDDLSPPSSHSSVSSRRTSAAWSHAPGKAGDDTDMALSSRGSHRHSPYALPSFFVQPPPSAPGVMRTSPLGASYGQGRQRQPQHLQQHRQLHLHSQESHQQYQQQPVHHQQSPYPYTSAGSPYHFPYNHFTPTTSPGSSLNHPSVAATGQIGSLQQMRTLVPPNPSAFSQPQVQAFSHSLLPPPPPPPQQPPPAAEARPSPPIASKPLAERIRERMGTPQVKLEGESMLLNLPEAILARIFEFAGYDYKKLVKRRSEMASSLWLERADPLKMVSYETRLQYMMNLDNIHQKIKYTIKGQETGLPKWVACYFCFKMKQPFDFQQATEQVLYAWSYTDQAAGEQMFMPRDAPEGLDYDNARSNPSSRRSSEADTSSAASPYAYSAGYGSAHGDRGGYGGFGHAGFAYSQGGHGHGHPMPLYMQYGHGPTAMTPAAAAAAAAAAASGGVVAGPAGGGGGYFDPANRSASPGSSWLSPPVLPEGAVEVCLRRYCIECGIRIGIYKEKSLVKPWQEQTKKWICGCVNRPPSQRIHDQEKTQSCDECGVSTSYREGH